MTRFSTPHVCFLNYNNLIGCKKNLIKSKNEIYSNLVNLNNIKIT